MWASGFSTPWSATVLLCRSTLCLTCLDCISSSWFVFVLISYPWSIHWLCNLCWFVLLHLGQSLFLDRFDYSGGSGAMKHILWLNIKKNAILLTKKMSALMNTSVWSFNSSMGTFTKSLATRFGLVQVVLHFNATMFLSQILSAMLMSWTVTGQSLIWLLLITYLKSIQDG